MNSTEPMKIADYIVEVITSTMSCLQDNYNNLLIVFKKQTI